MHTLHSTLRIGDKTAMINQDILVDDAGVHYILPIQRSLDDGFIYLRIDFDPNKTQLDPLGREGHRFLPEGLSVEDGRWVMSL